MGKRNKKRFTKADCKIGALLHYGFDHIEAAKVLFEDGNPGFLDSAGYLACLGVEMILKAWHMQLKGWFEDTHNICQLYGEIVESDGNAALEGFEERYMKILALFSELRYPGGKEPSEIGDTDWLGIDRLLQEIWQRVPQELRDEYAKLDPARKGSRILMVKPKGPDDDEEEALRDLL